MKIVRMTIRVSVCFICVLLALAFIGIEGFALFSGEWKLFENGAITLIQQISKVIVSLSAFLTALSALAKPRRSFLWISAAFLICAIFAHIFMCNRFGMVFIFLSAVFILSDIGF